MRLHGECGEAIRRQGSDAVCLSTRAMLIWTWLLVMLLGYCYLVFGNMKLLETAAAVAAILTCAQSASEPKPLVPLVYEPIPLGQITPNGWLLSEMQTEANGLAGHLYDFYQFVKDAKWMGGTQEYSGLNEAFPYWLNGLVPLAYTLDDKRLKGQVDEAMSYLFEHMIQPDGWIGFEEGGYRLIWARTLIFFSWTNLADANQTYEKPIVNAMYNFNTLMHSMLKNNGTGLLPQKDGVLSDDYYFWFRSRVAEMVVSLQWLYEKHPRRNETKRLWENMEMLHDYGYKWEEWFNEAAYAFEDLYDLPETVTDDNFQFLHGVNVGEGLKAPAVIRRFTHNDSLIQTTNDGVQWSMKYHGAPSGTIYADERENGINPYYGSETCTAVEVMFSNSYNYQALGENFYGDGSELAAFNALPGAMTGDWWAHVYMSQANQPYSKNLSTTPFYDTNSVGQTYGLEPNYPCCTVNHPQGLPKFVQAAFVKKGNNGLVHALLSPATVKTSISGGKTTVECQTNYPFGDELSYQIDTQKPFDFYVRVPSWATGVKLTKAHGPPSTYSSRSGLQKISVPEGKSNITYNIGTIIRTEPRANDTVAIYRGQLLYALEIGAHVTSAPPRNYRNQTIYPAGYAPPESRDYTMLNTTEWNVAIDPSTIKYHPAADPQASLPTPIFASGKPPMYMTVKACLIDWPLFLGAVPGWPIPKNERKCLGDSFHAKLVPYGSAKLRMSELPVIELS